MAERLNYTYSWSYQSLIKRFNNTQTDLISIRVFDSLQVVSDHWKLCSVSDVLSSVCSFFIAFFENLFFSSNCIESKHYFMNTHFCKSLSFFKLLNFRCSVRSIYVTFLNAFIYFTFSARIKKGGKRMCFLSRTELVSVSSAYFSLYSVCHSLHMIFLFNIKFCCFHKYYIKK